MVEVPAADGPVAALGVVEVPGPDQLAASAFGEVQVPGLDRPVITLGAVEVAPPPTSR